MDEKTFLEAWLNNLNIVLQDTKKSIAKIEDNKENNEQFADIQIQLMEKWLNDETLKEAVREDLKGILKKVKNRKQDNAEQLAHLKIVEESTTFMIEKIKQEQNH